METKVNDNGQARNDTVKTGKTSQFVAGNPVNAESKKAEETKPAEQPKGEEAKPQASAQEHFKPEPTKTEIKEQLAQQKPALNLEETLKLVADLAKKIGLRDRYKDYIDGLAEFEKLQKENIDELEDESAFQQCELTITSSKGYRFSINSPPVIKGTVAFISGRLGERMAEVEASIVLPA